MKKIRILSAVLAILLAFSAIGLPVFAGPANGVVDYPSYEDWTSQALRVADMTEMYADENWKLYVDTQSAEIALYNVKTGEYTFSNPYDIAINSEFGVTTTDPNEDPIRQALLSQIILTYEDVATGATYTMKSYTDAVLAGDQITFAKIDDGVRVEYAIGTVETKRLFPQWIEKSRFEELIYTPLKQYYNEHKSEFAEGDAPGSIRASHILIKAEKGSSKRAISCENIYVRKSAARWRIPPERDETGSFSRPESPIFSI